MDIQDILEEAEKVAAYMNANTPVTVSEDNIRSLLTDFFEKNNSILDIRDQSVFTHCDCEISSVCYCDCSIYLDVHGIDWSVTISTYDGLILGDGPQGNKFGGCDIRKKDSRFFITKIFDDNLNDVWHREYNYDDYFFEDP